MVVRDLDVESSLSADQVINSLDKYLDRIGQSMGQDGGNSGSQLDLSYATSSSHVYSTMSRIETLSRDLNGGSNRDHEFVTSITVDSSSLSESSDSEVSSLQLIWRNISYEASTPSWLFGSRKKKRILDRQNGQANGGNLTAIIGPSGAGKSTLLECLSGRRRTGLRGDIYISYDKNQIKNGVKLSFIGQKDDAIDNLTVREVLMFASKIKNIGRSSKRVNSHQSVDAILSELHLVKCADIYVKRISGGQLKRLVFGVELISGPDIILLDEPTSGLDSSSAFQCIQLMRKLTESKSPANQRSPLIMCSIHQPSARVLGLFHRIYILSNDGRCLYHGPPLNLLGHLTVHGIQCPVYHNPADFIIELASGDYGLEPMNKLAQAESDHQMKIIKKEKLIAISGKVSINFDNSRFEQSIGSSRIYVKVAKVINRMKAQPFPVFKHTWLLLKRTLTVNFREPKLTWFRLIQAIFIGLLMSFLYDHDIGQPDGCHPLSYEQLINPKKSTNDNIAFIFFIMLFTVMASMMPTVLTFPSELTIMLQERNNGWYSAWTYYVAKIMADTPLQLVITIIFTAIVYPLTGQVADILKFGLFCAISMLVSSIAQCVGIFFGIYYVTSVENAVFLAPLSMAPVFLFSGFFGKISSTPIYLRPLAYLSYVRYAFEALLVILYGLDRCPGSGQSVTSLFRIKRQLINTGLVHPNTIEDVKRLNRRVTKHNAILKISPTLKGQIDLEKNGKIFTLPESLIPNQNNFTNVYQTELSSNQTGSYVLQHYDIDDYTLVHNLIILIAFLITMRILCYFLLLWRTNRTK